NHKGVPAADSPICASHRAGASMKPSINAVGPAVALFKFVRSSGFDGILKDRERLSAVIWMNGIVGCPTSFHFLERFAEIFQELPIEKFNLTFGTHSAHETGNTIDNLAKFFYDAGSLSQSSGELP